MNTKKFIAEFIGTFTLIFVGVVAIAGVVLLSNTAYGWSLAWVKAWWPVAPIGLGVYMLARGVRDRVKG